MKKTKKEINKLEIKKERKRRIFEGCRRQKCKLCKNFKIGEFFVQGEKCYKTIIIILIIINKK